MGVNLYLEEMRFVKGK